MNKLFLIALVLTVSISRSSAFDSSTSEGHIKNLIQIAKDRCSNCQDTADKVLTRTSKGDICDAVDAYQFCAISCISSNTVVDQVHDAQKICNGAGVIQMSLLLLFLAAIAKSLF